MKNYFLFIFSMFPLFTLLAQDSIIVYEVSTQQISTIAPIQYDTNQVFDYSSSSMGTMGSSCIMSQSPPSTNLFPSSQFSDISRAELFHSLTDYPIRCAVNLITFEADTMVGPGCSGIMVGPDMVLTAAHCLKLGAWRTDSVLIAPAYNNGQFQSGLPTSFSKKYYLFQNNVNGSLSQEIALIQLQEPIGLDIGWISLAYSNDNQYFDGKVFHKLSYPASTSFMDTTKVYNGDTLYYNYGYIDTMPLAQYSFGVNGAFGIGGQSGSSLFYTDNNLTYYTFGVFSTATNYRHARISQARFYQLQNIIDNYGTTIPIDKIKAPEIQAKVYPNPFRHSTTIEFENFSNSPHFLSITDLQGRLVREQPNITDNKVIIYRNNLPIGLYFFHLSNTESKSMVGKLLIRD